jgi:hypothetical protein
MVGGEQDQLLAAALGLERLDPGVELLRRELFPELRGERRPKRIHGRKRGFCEGLKRGGIDVKFYSHPPRLSTAAQERRSDAAVALCR